VNYYLNSNRLGIVLLMNHAYGNYVIQRLFECSDEFLRRKIYERIQNENIDEIKRNGYGM